MGSAKEAGVGTSRVILRTVMKVGDELYATSGSGRPVGLSGVGEQV